MSKNREIRMTVKSTRLTFRVNKKIALSASNTFFLLFLR